MQISEREQFEAHLGKLYGAYNMPLSKSRAEAFFSGLTKMPLSQFVRCVDYCLGEKGPEKIPSVAALWGIRKRLSEASVPKEQPKHEQDHLLFFANRLMLLHLSTRGGLDKELPACLKVKADLVEFYEELIRENSPHANPASFVGDWCRQLAAVSAITPKALSEYTRFVGDPKFRVAFPQFMARKLA